MRALLPCKSALPSGSPDTVNTAVALQLASKTCASVVVVVVVVVFAGRRLASGGGTDTGALLLLLLAGVGAARWEPPWRANQLRHPPSRSGTYASPRFREQCEQLQ
ncbi:hypothetical protein H4582DRAFT_1959953 [Lactarius indigo]|nr:hypothetical protein H4582DRAFT_1959953 [Lactarius indigo]